MEGDTIGLEAALNSSKIVARGQLQRWWQPLDVEDALLEMLRPHWLEDAINTEQSLDDSPVMNTGKVKTGLPSKW